MFALFYARLKVCTFVEMLQSQLIAVIVCLSTVVLFGAFALFAARRKNQEIGDMDADFFLTARNSQGIFRVGKY